MATPGRDEHQLVRGLPGCSACTTPFAPGAGAPTKLRSSDFIEQALDVPSRRDGSRKLDSHGNAGEGRAPARPRTTSVYRAVATPVAPGARGPTKLRSSQFSERAL